MRRFSLHKFQLLKTAGDFQDVYRLGRRLYGKGFAIIFMPNAKGFCRLGISVQRKTGNAVRRNRVKRLIREVFRLNRELFPSSCDIVFTLRPGFAIDRLTDMHASVVRLMSDK